METVVRQASRQAEVEYGGPHPWQTTRWARVVRRLMRYREYTRWVNQYCTPLTVRGTVHLDVLDEPAIFIANHQSHMDTPVIVESLPDRIRDNLYFGAAADRWFVKGKKKLILQPWYQSLVMGNFPIVRGGGSRTLDYAKSLLARGCNVCIFPEGTRATTDQLGEFRHGVTLLARATGVPVVPIVLKGLREMRPKGSREIIPGPASTTILEPIRIPDHISIEAGTALMRDAMNLEFSATSNFISPTTEEEERHYVKAA